MWSTGYQLKPIPPRSVGTKESLRAFQPTLAAFTSGNQQSGLMPSLLLHSAEPTQVRQLIAATVDYQNAVRAFPKELGPQAKNRVETNDLQRRRFDVQELCRAGHRNQAAWPDTPQSTNLAQSAAVFRASLAMVHSRTNLALEASSDLRQTTTIQEHSASEALYGTYCGLSWSWPSRS